MRFPFYRQHDMMDCGPTCLRMVAKYYGKSVSLQLLRQKCQIQRQGVNLLGISEAAESIGLKTLGAKIDYRTLLQEVQLPCIVHWNKKHFVVVYKITDKYVWIADPGNSTGRITKKEFERSWLSIHNDEQSLGVVLLMEPGVNFKVEEGGGAAKTGFRSVMFQVVKHRKMFFQLIIGFLIGLLLQIIFPFLTQSVVDVGIGSRDIGFIKLILLAQLMLYAGSTFMDFIRNWLMLHLSTRINLSLLTDFFIKLMKLPMSFFDTKMTGDITQRMTDYGRIQTFLTNTLLDTSFSLVSFVVFTFIAVTYSVKLFFIFLIGSILYFLWLFLFLPSRKRMDFRRFSLGADNSNETIEMITGMQEIKLNNCERQKRWKWEKIQARIFRLSIDSLLLNQVQSAGALFINQGKNIFITYVSATEAVNGNLSIGSMMAVQYIMGQLNNPVQQIIRFVQSYQDAKISMERIDEIHSMEDEDAVERMQLESLPAQKNIEIKNLSFKYPGYDNEHVLIGMDLSIPAGKTTAIVGMSGSGKTTLLKLLLRYYQIEEGSIKIGNSTLASINTGLWRSRCGVVMQDGFIFSDTIAANIAVGDDYPDHERLMHAMKVANIEEFVDSLPLGLNTIIGGQGKGISQGQKQRILIARAVYKEPDFVFLDEATNSLDANNETAIMNNLADFLKGKTVVVVAHRLSTVRNADQIVVLDKGCITEIGTHAELTARKKDYYRLVRNQLELGN